MGFLVEYRNRVNGRPGTLLVHSHDCYEIYTYLGGEGIYLFYVGEAMYALEPGDVVICRPGVFHFSFKKMKARYRRLYIRLEHTQMKLIKEIAPEVYRFLKYGAAHIRPVSELAEAYGELTEELCAPKYSSSEPDGCLYLFGKVMEYLAVLYRAVEMLPVPAAASADNALIHRIIAYINENYASITGISDIADGLSYSKNHLSACFKREMDIGLHEFLTEKRLSAAAVKLLADMSVTECAIECGFSSPSHFISVFKKKYGMTPKEYQSQNIIKK